jgi:hypothetical protein
MKKIVLSAFAAALLVACGGADPKKDAQEVCDCYSKANGLPADDANRAAEQTKCLELQTKKYEAYKDNMDQMNEFNTTMSECSKKLIEESFK